MKRKNFALYSIFVLVLLLVYLAGMPTFNVLGQNNEGITLTVGYSTGVDTLDPQMASDSTLCQLDQIFEKLIMRNDDMKLEPGLAKSWNYNPDNQTWLFKLREGVKWHDGSEFTAEDVKFSFDRLLELGSKVVMIKSFKKLEKTEIVDKYTVKCFMQEPAPQWPLDLAWAPSVIPKDYFQEVGSKEFAQHPVGTGPYKVSSWSRGNKLVLESFDNYWRGEPEIDKVIFRIIPDSFTRVSELLSGGVDVLVSLSTERIPDIEKREKLQVKTGSGATNVWLGFNTLEKPFSNLQVRKAVAHAINLPEMAESLFGGRIKVANSHLQSVAFGYNPDVERYRYNPDKAKQLLSKAGYSNGFETTLYPAIHELWPKSEEIALAISGYLGDIGIKVHVKTLEWATWFDKYLNRDIHEMYIFGNTCGSFDADRSLSINYTSPKTGGRALYGDGPIVSALIDYAGRISDQEDRKKLYFLAQERLMDNLPTIPLFEYTKTYAFNKKFDVPLRADGQIWAYSVKVR